jgi:chloramphenicol-sensitive protein RarD
MAELIEWKRKNNMTGNNRGIVYALGAYGLWGILPIFWKVLKAVPAYELLCHRIIWTFIVMMAIIALRHGYSWLTAFATNRRALIIFCGSSVLIGLNWFVYIWAVNANYIVEASLGYFINPLVNVLLGMIFLHERLRRGQMIAILLAACGVLYLTFSHGTFPWLAILLAVSFALYALLRKTAPLNAIQGLTVEIMILIVPAAVFLWFLDANHAGSFWHNDVRIAVPLMLTGFITAVPMILFAAAARRVTMTSLGLTQYLSPTIQFFIGIYMYHEPFSHTRLVGFIIVWVALIIYSTESIVVYIRSSRLQKAVGNSSIL